MSEFLIRGPAGSDCTLLLAHGAGAPMTSPFLEAFAELMAARGIATARFEFAYMAARRSGGGRRAPTRAELLMPEYVAAVDRLRAATPPPRHLFIGGKSMGGRVASMVADELSGAGRIAGLVCLGYPFHPPGKPARLRTAHLVELAAPSLFVQGERDAFGSREEVERLALSPAIDLHWIAGGDHDLSPGRGRGVTRAQSLAAVADVVATFTRRIAAGRKQQQS